MTEPYAKKVSGKLIFSDAFVDLVRAGKAAGKSDETIASQAMENGQEISPSAVEACRKRHGIPCLPNAEKPPKAKPVKAHDPERKMRVCLGHLHDRPIMFLSSHKGNRMCPSCRASTSGAMA